MRDLDTREYFPEIVGGLVFLVVAALLPHIGVSTDVAWFTAVMAVLLPLSVATVKVHVTSTARRALSVRQGTMGRAGRIGVILGELDGDSFARACRIADRAIAELEQIEKGVIPLDSAEYFHAIIGAMSHAPRATQVHAVNTINELRWRHDPQEVNYLEANLGALGRGVKIERVFVLDRGRFFADDPQSRIAVIREQASQKGLSVFVAWKESLASHQIKFRDGLALDKPVPVLYVDYPDPADSTRVARGEMITAISDVASFLGEFSLLRDNSTPVKTFLADIAQDLDSRQAGQSQHRPELMSPQPVTEDPVGTETLCNEASRDSAIS